MLNISRHRNTGEGQISPTQKGVMSVMRRYSPYHNIFYYYREPSSRISSLPDKQIENNATKALINTLENGGQRLTVEFLKWADIPIEEHGNCFYRLQPSGDGNTPDAEIIAGKTKVLFENKLDAPLDAEQLKRHLSEGKGAWLLCITPREDDGVIVNRVDQRRVRFVTWRAVYAWFRDRLSKVRDATASFVVSEFIRYLEVINTTTKHNHSTCNTLVQIN